VIHSTTSLFTLGGHYGGQTGEKIVVKWQSKVRERNLCQWKGGPALAQWEESFALLCLSIAFRCSQREQCM